MGVRRDAKRNVWFIDFYYTTKSGEQKRFRKDSAAKNKKDALAEEARISANVAIYGSPYAPVETTQDGAITFQKAVDEFRVGMAKVELKASTRHGYDEILNSILLPKFGKERIGDIDYLMVQKLDGEMVERGCSNSRRRNVQCVLRTVLGVAVDCGRMSAMPKLPELPKVGRTVTKVMTFEQVRLVIRYAVDDAVLPMSLSALCGLRSGEVRALHRKNLDLSGWITVAESLSHGEIDTPKSGHARKVPIPAMLLGLFKQMHAAGKLPEGIICTRKSGRPWTEVELSQAFARAAKKAGVKGFRMHDLRHFYVTFMFRAGVPANVIQALAGHEKLSTTQLYSHTSDDDAQVARERFTLALEAGGGAANLAQTTGIVLGEMWAMNSSNDDPHEV